ncbi:hypothetical protein WJX84_005042 [Apatococcus fuscideae]|uniref:Uncharacterized protein n=1 Tax=Apatococcus fuscideae TaxID=2026836 RepID=A0AAW1SNE2_9CHLO
MERTPARRRLVPLPPERKALFVHVRLNRVHCRVTYQGAPLNIKDFKILLDQRVYERLEGKWHDLLNRVKWDTVRSVLKSVTGLQRSKFKEVMRDAEDRVSVSKPVPPPELLDPREPLPEFQPSRTGFKASLNTSVNKLLNKKAAVVQEVPDPDVARAERKRMMLLGQQGGSAPGKTGFGNIMSGQLANVADKMHLGGQLGRLRAGAASIMRPSGSKAAQPAVSAPRKRSSDEGHHGQGHGPSTASQRADSADLRKAALLQPSRDSEAPRYSPEKPPSGSTSRKRSGSGQLSSRADSTEPVTDPFESALQAAGQEHQEIAASPALIDNDPLAAYLGGRLPSQRMPSHQPSLRSTWATERQQGRPRTPSGLDLSELLRAGSSDSQS